MKDLFVKMVKMLIAMIISCNTFSAHAQMSVMERGLHGFVAAGSFGAAGLCAMLCQAGIIMKKTVEISISKKSSLSKDAQFIKVNGNVLCTFTKSTRPLIVVIGMGCVLSGLYHANEAWNGSVEKK